MTRYAYATRKGTFYIQRRPSDQKWSIWFEDDCLDAPYATAQQAVEDLANGHSTWPSFGDPSLLGIPEDISYWKPF
jgi:hypothetical protein